MKIISNLYVTLAFLFFAGCAFVPVDKIKTDTVVLAKEIVQVPGNFAPKGISNTFTLEDPFVNVFVTINWSEDHGAGVKLIKWEWITDGDIKHEVKRRFNFYDAPFYLTGNVKTIAMGKGKHKVKLFIEDQLFAEESFEIK